MLLNGQIDGGRAIKSKILCAVLHNVTGRLLQGDSEPWLRKILVFSLGLSQDEQPEGLLREGPERVWHLRRR